MSTEKSNRGSRTRRRIFSPGPPAPRSPQRSRQRQRHEATANTSPPQSIKRPLNVLFFMSDDMRAELACYNSRFNVAQPKHRRPGRQRRPLRPQLLPVSALQSVALFALHRSSARAKPTFSATRCRHDRQHPEWMTLPHLFREARLHHAAQRQALPRRPRRPRRLDRLRRRRRIHFMPTRRHADEHPRARSPCPMARRASCAADRTIARAAHSDEILVLDGNGEGAGDYMVADLAIKYLASVSPAIPGQAVLRRLRLLQAAQPPQAPQRFFDMYDPAQIQLPPDFAAWPTVPPASPKPPSARATPTSSSAAARRRPKRRRLSAPISPPSPGRTGTSAASSPT